MEVEIYANSTKYLIARDNKLKKIIFNFCNKLIILESNFFKATTYDALEILFIDMTDDRS